MSSSVKPQNSRQALEHLEHIAGLGLEPEAQLIEAAVSTVAGAVDFSRLLEDKNWQNAQFGSSARQVNVDFVKEGQFRPEQVHERHGAHSSAWLLATHAGTDDPCLRVWLQSLEARLARSVQLARASDVVAAFSEMIDNAQEHGRSDRSHTLTFELGKRWWIFSVTDDGPGVPSTIRSLPRYRGLSDFDAVCEALKDGVSCTDEPGRGGGFRRLIRVLLDSNCAIHMRTGFVSVFIHGNAVEKHIDQSIFSWARRGLHLRARGVLS